MREAPIDLIRRGRTDAVMEEDVLTALTEGGEALRWCAYYGDVTALRVLMKAGSSLEVLGSNFGLAGAAFHGHWRLCEFLLELGADARWRNPATGETALHSALCHDDRERYDPVVATLIAHGADVHARTEYGAPTESFMRDARTRGETALHRAAALGGEGTIRMLLDAGANKEAWDMNGETPLAWGSWHRRPAAILRLLSFGPHRISTEYRPLRVSVAGEPAPPEGNP